MRANQPLRESYSKDTRGDGSETCLTGKNLAKLIDHTLLKPEATEEAIVRLCQEAREYGFASVCVNPCYVKLAHRVLENSPVKVCTVIGFPSGATTTRVKAYEARIAVEEGAQEVDMVINIGKLKSGDYDYVEEDIRAVVEAAGPGIIVKVILETCLLTEEEKIKGCLLAKQAGAHFVKTSTGFGKEGATVADVTLMRKVVGSEMGIKAAGGIRDFETAVRMVEAGATRIGTSASVAIVKEGAD